MPPPNITGILHMGHAMFTTLQDILIRYHRMQGYNTLWLPGTDHAGLATQEKLDEEMRAQGLDPKGPSSKLSRRTTRSASAAPSTSSFAVPAHHATGRATASRSTRNIRDAVKAAFELCRDDMYEEGGQLYLDMREPAKQLIAEIDAGNLKIIPEQRTKTLLHFLENIEPWCISRQIRWGHKIPGREDVLDTWFSSALWPFATLGWPHITDDLKTFYPATLIETADDILFFWCARMLMMG
jgi:valyl-tRNA synthetase